jgi:hypothetical protein
VADCSKCIGRQPKRRGNQRQYGDLFIFNTLQGPKPNKADEWISNVPGMRPSRRIQNRQQAVDQAGGKVCQQATAK